MGIWDYISSTTDSIKRNAPGPASVKGFCFSSYNHSRAAVTRIQDAVYKLSPYVPDVETRSKFAVNLALQTATVAVREGAKLVPGGSIVHDIVVRSIPREKKSKKHAEDVQESKDRVGETKKEQEMNDWRRSLEQCERDKLLTDLKTTKTLDLNKKPEEIIKFFRTTEFTGKLYLEDLSAHGVTPEKQPK